MRWERPPHVFARRALVAGEWRRDVLLHISEAGNITSVSDGSQPPAATRSFDLLLPGMPNVHSHAFQRAMAGLTESASPGRDDNFWRWREVMYALARVLTPEDVGAIALVLYIELLKHGYTAVGEFHYLHHDVDGQPYAALTELSDEVITAAQAAGIHITHLPVLYETSNFGGAGALEGQRRFVNNPERYLELLAALIRRYSTTADVVLGVAPHSLRAVRPESLRMVLDALPRLGLGECPIHVAEQEKEVQDCLAWSGQRPVGWLLAHGNVDARWCLIHATHMTPEEIAGVVRCDATVGLCPSTEANLGDGIFPAQVYLEAQGVFGIGSDSHIGLSPYEELRLLEYAQRLSSQRRAVLCRAAMPSVGHRLYTEAAAGGSQALAIHAGCIAPGYRADLVGVALSDPVYTAKEGDRILDTLVFAVTQPAITDVFVSGKWVIKDGAHPCEEEAAAKLRKTLQTLQQAL